MTLDVVQTPPKLKSREEEGNEYTRIDFYLEQFIDCLLLLKNISFIAADGFYAKKKVFDTITFYGKHLR